MLKVLLFCCFFFEALCVRRHFRIGGVFNSHENVRLFTNTVDEINTELLNRHANITLDGSAVLANSNDILTYIDFCKNIISKHMHGLLVVANENELENFKLILKQSTALGIPTFVVGIRNNILSDKRTYPTLLRTISPTSYQVDGWIAMMRHFGFRAFHLIHALDTDGHAFRTRVEKHIDTFEDDLETDIKLKSIVNFDPSQDSFKSELIGLLGVENRVFFLHAALKDLCLILKEAEELRLTGSGFVWFVSEVAIGCATIPQGAIILRQRLAGDIGGHVKDSLHFMVKGLSTLPITNEEPPSQCIFNGDPWFPGYQFFHNAMKLRSSNTVTGYLSMDYYGNREYSNYDILNVDVNEKKNVVGTYLHNKTSKSMVLTLNDTAIKWAGGSTVKPSGAYFLRHLRVVTVPDVPFVYARQVDEDFECSRSEVPCPLYKENKKTLYRFCCDGYSIELLKHLAEKVNFTYSLFIPSDGMFGSYDYHSHPDMKSWSGIVGSLTKREADIAVGALTSTEERANTIDLSAPFRHQGIAVLERKLTKTSTLVSFLQPFRDTLWITVMVAVHVVALTLYLLDRCSPFGRYRMPNSEHPEEDALNLSSAIWFSWGVLLNSGIGEGTPRSFSARVLGMVWAGFAMIIVASYTANLAAFLVLDRPKTTLHGLYDPRMRNPTDNFTFSTVRGSAVEYYLKNQFELSRVYKTMSQYAVDTADDGIQAVKAERLSAFVWDSTRLEYESARDCDLVVSSEVFARSGYVVGLQKGSRWTNSISRAILDLLEHGTLAHLDRKWIVGRDPDQEECDKPSGEPATLGLRSMAGVFIMVAAGIFGGVALIGIEILFKRYYSRKQRRYELARHAFDKWKSMVKRRKILRTTIEHQRRSKANGTVAIRTTPTTEYRNDSSIFVIGEGRYFDV